MSVAFRPFFSVITPTYNRAHTLGRAFVSLCDQTFQDFEWVVIDDGSNDATGDLVARWQAQARFPIQYHWQVNQHKKVAFNRGVARASGHFVVVLDSDDTLAPNALFDMAAVWNDIPEADRHRFAAVTGLCARPDGRIVGDAFPDDVFDASVLDITFREGVRGEKFGCTRTDILRRFPYPEDIPGYVPESLVWRAIARAGYLTRFVNQVFRVYYPTQGSLTSQSALTTGNLPGLCLLARDTVVNCLPWFRYRPLEFFKAAARYSRFRLALWRSGLSVPAAVHLHGAAAWCLVVLALPVGVTLHLLDQQRGGMPSESPKENRHV